MKNILSFCFAFVLIVGFSACGSDDDNGSVPVRDRGEVDLEDQSELQTYLQTHFWNYEEYANLAPGAEFSIVLDTIEGVNASKTPLINQVTTSVLNRQGIDYTIYTLKARQGGATLSPTFADSALVTYKGFLLDGSLFDSSSNAIWFDLPTSIDGFMEGVTQFNGASSFNQNPDGTLSYTDSGVGAVFMPSGVGYFSRSQTGVPAYSPLIFTFELRSTVVTDHDGDGILSRYEDLNGDRDLTSTDNLDNTDEDIPVVSNYRDADDDGDGILTRDENPDPNGDGNPNDAVDSDNDNIPDYLDDDTRINN